MQKLVVLSGAGVSAESGIRTFRDSNGLWEEYRVEDVASIDGWHRNRELVIEFYNQRRRQLETAQPNEAHKLIAALETMYDVTVVTQNIDNLHERGGSTKIIHLHGELTKVRSVKARECDYDHPDTAASCNTASAHKRAAESASKAIFEIGYKDIHLGDLAPDGGQLRPHIVWFGEAVPELTRAIKA
ncbi:MAG: Sir2 family NAD-dependent protein deacetylase, partial [Bacteroidales bacterium]